MQGITWDASLIQRYNINGPRYTSYPTAVEMTPDFEHQTVFNALAGSDQRLSLYIHLPFCAKLCYYCGCNKIITRHQEKAAEYLDVLEKEILFYKPLIAHRGVGALHLGGGTPTFLTEEQLTRLMDMLVKHLDLDVHSGHEISVEVDPRTCSLEKLEHLKNLGFNRVSYGIQDMDLQVQIAINRVQEEPLVNGIIQKTKDLKFNSMNLDLIYGLPHQHPRSFRETLRKVIAWAPERVSLFSYAHIPEKFASQRKLDNDSLPTADVKLELLQMGIDMFTDAGYQFIGMDHFAKPHDELATMQREGKLQRNFQGYTTHGSNSLLGLGSSSISQINGVIWQNEKSLKKYERMVEAQGHSLARAVSLTHDDNIRADLIAELICHFTMDKEAFGKKWNLDFNSYFADGLAKLQPFIDDGLVEHTDSHIHITGSGRLLVRSICAMFDAYFKQGQSGFSKVI